MSWLILIVAGLLEVAWAVGLKSSASFTRPGVVAVTVVALVASVGMLGVAMRELPVGAAYAVWTGIGAVGTVLVGIACFGEPVTIGRLVSLSLILLGIVGLKLASHS